MARRLFVLLFVLLSLAVLVNCSLSSTTRGVTQKDVRDLLIDTTTEEVPGTTEEPITPGSEGGGESEGAGGEGEEGGHQTGPMALNERNSILVIITCLIVISIIFEFIKQIIEHAADEDMKPIVEGLFKELTVLGFVALVMFLVTQGNNLHSLSEQIFGEGEDDQLTELMELIHFMLFGMMVMFIIEVMFLVRVAMRSEKKWREKEEKVRSAAAIEECRAVVNKGHSPPKWRKYLRLMSPQERKYKTCHSILQYAQMRAAFIKEFNHQRSDILSMDSFDFNEYLTMCLAKQLEEIVEIHPVTWVIVFAFILVAWAILSTQRIVWIVTSTLLSYLLLGVAFGVTHKLLHIRKNLVFRPPPNHEIDLDDPSASKPAYRHRQLRPRSKLGKLIMGAPGNLHEQLFWFDKYGPRFLSHFLRVLLLMTAIYVCVFAAFISRVTLWKYGTGADVGVIIVAYLPVVCLIGYIFPRYINRLSLSVSIEMMKNSDVVSAVLQKSSIKKLVKMVQFITSMKSTLQTIKLAQETARITRDGLESGASQMEGISEEFKEEMRQAFDVFDIDHSGSISPEEFQQLMELMGYKTTPSELENIMKIIDVNNDNLISLEEFTIFSFEVNKDASQKEESLEEFIDTAFSIFDSDNSGHVTKSEFVNVLTRIYPQINIDVANEIADEIDHDKSGYIEKHDFGKIIKQHMKELKKERPKSSRKGKKNSLK